MFQARRRRSNLQVFLSLMELTYHSAVRKVRQQHGNAFMALAMSIFQAIAFVAGFYIMFEILNTRTMAIRGNFIVYLLTGIYLYLTHIKALGAVMGSEGPASPMMQHGPMNTLVAIMSSALQVLYLQTLALIIILVVVHIVIEPVVIHDWAGAFMMFLLAWFSGVAVGLLLLALKPWIPDVVTVINTVWSRANMVASGKMFVANLMTASMVAMFDWNPLFHIIDQCRGFTFGMNYVPHHSNWQYPVYVCLALVTLGMIGEFYTRKNVSASWNAAR
ncbi:ABC transporter permease [Rhodobacterales bacterium HKCCE3408]|nr:ABC transporter permease [Rhodobacterales bacterium HKCCE3408]